MMVIYRKKIETAQKVPNKIPDTPEHSTLISFLTIIEKNIT
jgi:hypothetical protein